MALKDDKNVGDPTNWIEFLIWYREENGLSQRVLGEILGVTQPYIRKLERGDDPLPLKFLKKLYKNLTSKEQTLLLRCINNDIRNYMQSKN